MSFINSCLSAVLRYFLRELQMLSYLISPHGNNLCATLTLIQVLSEGLVYVEILFIVVEERRRHLPYLGSWRLSRYLSIWLYIQVFAIFSLDICPELLYGRG